MTTAWIMVNSDGFPFTSNFHALYEGFKKLGVDIKTYTAADLFSETIPYHKDHLVVGHIDQCRRHIKNITGKDVPNIDYPEPLIPFMKRKFEIRPLSSVYGRMTIDENPEPIFVKSVSQKFITGFVCNNFSDFVRNCTGIPLDTLVYTSDVVDMKSEYRTYIHRHQIMNSIRYKGDWDKAPRKSVVEDMLYAVRNEKMPIAYSIDVAVLENHSTVLIECNDGFALGNYGLSAMKYAEMNMDRWYQLIEELS